MSITQSLGKRAFSGQPHRPSPGTICPIQYQMNMYPTVTNALMKILLIKNDLSCFIKDAQIHFVCVKVNATIKFCVVWYKISFGFLLWVEMVYSSSYLVPIHKWSFCPISVLRSKNYPRNINYMPSVIF